jgi:uncharacterized OB-fold protein
MGLPRYAPPEDGLFAPFWDAVGRHQIALPRCTSCGRWQWYPTSAGADCPDGELAWTPVATTGTVLTLTRVERAFLPKGKDDVPFVVAFVELDGVEGVRLVANLEDTPEARIGMRVVADFVPHDGRTHLLFRAAA